MLGMNAYGVRGNANEPAGLRRPKERNHAKRRAARRVGHHLGTGCSCASSLGRFGWPRFEWSCAFRRAHFAPQRRNFTFAGYDPTCKPQADFLEIAPSAPVRCGAIRWHSPRRASTCGKRRKCPIFKHLVIVRKLAYYMLWISAPNAQPIWCSTRRHAAAIRILAGIISNLAVACLDLSILFGWICHSRPVICKRWRRNAEKCPRLRLQALAMGQVPRTWQGRLVAKPL